MARIKVNNIPDNEKLDKRFMKQIFGGPTAVEYAVMLSLIIVRAAPGGQPGGKNPIDYGSMANSASLS